MLKTSRTPIHSPHQQPKSQKESHTTQKTFTTRLRQPRPTPTTSQPKHRQPTHRTNQIQPSHRNRKDTLSPNSLHTIPKQEPQLHTSTGPPHLRHHHQVLPQRLPQQPHTTSQQKFYQLRRRNPRQHHTTQQPPNHTIHTPNHSRTLVTFTVLAITTNQYTYHNQSSEFATTDKVAVPQPIKPDQGRSASVKRTFDRHIPQSEHP